MKKKFFRVIAHHLPQCLLLISILTSNVLFPASVIAQEIENTNNIPQEETVPIDTSEDILEEGISTSIYEETEAEAETEVETEKEIIEEEEVVEPPFVFENGIYTVKNVIQGEEYVYPDNNDVRVKFTEVTQEGNLVIKRVELTEEQKELLNTKDNYGWDITSSMSNGTFKYNLTLPNTQGNEDIEVKYTEDNNTYESIDNNNVEIKSNVVTIEGLDHFTLFVVVDDGDTDFSAPGWSSHDSGYQGDHKYVTSSQTDKTATWTYSGDPITNGAIFLSWTIWVDHATNATYKSSLFPDVTVNQKLNAEQTATDTNGKWSGWYRVPNTGSLSIPSNSTVTLSTNDSPNGNLSADAVAFVDLNEVPNEVWVDDNYSYNNSGEHFWGYDAFNKIQDGINAVASGGTVYVASGTYTEYLDITKSIILKSINGYENTTIKGSIQISSDNVAIDGFTIDNDNQTDGRAIAPKGSNGTTITNNKIINAYRGIQGDYYGRPTNLTITNNIFENISYGIAGTEGITNLLITGNIFKTSQEGIGLGAGITFPTGKTIDDLLTDNTFNLTGGYAVGDYRSGSLKPVKYTADGSLLVEEGDSIQAAINAASVGDTIKVARGTYTENLTINKRLKIEGSGSGDTTNDTIITPSLASTPVVTITTSGTSDSERLVLSNIRVKGTGNNSEGILIPGSISYTTFSNVASVNNGSNGVNVSSSGGIGYDLKITDCVFSNNGGSGFRTGDTTIISGLTITNTHADSNKSAGLYFNGPLTGLNIDGGSFNNNYDGDPNKSNGIGIYASDGNGGINRGFGPSGYKSNSIKNTSVSGNSRGIILNIWGGSSYLFDNITASNNNATSSDSGQGITIGSRNTINEGITFSNITAENNSISNLWFITYAPSSVSNLSIQNSKLTNSSGYGLYLYAATGSTLSNISVTGSTITGNNTGIYLRAGSSTATLSNISIEENSIGNNGTGILISNNISSGNSAHKNNIVGNTIAGIQNNDTDTVFDATLNWWGHITGPSTTVGNGLGDKVSTNVTYQEWLCAPYQENVTSVPSVSGVCTLTAPTQTGYNVKNSPTDPENTPRPINEIACTGGYTNINSVSVHWTDVSGGDSNIKYQRQYKVNNGGWTGNEIYTNPYTGYRSFGGGTGNNGIYGSQVRAFYDTNGNGQYNIGEPVSGWSNECSITYDKTVPTISNVNVDKTFVKAGDIITITADVTDNNGVLAVSADFSYNENYSSRPTPTSVTMTKTPGNTYQVQYTVPSSWAEGIMYIKVAARDLTGGNWVRSTEYKTVTVDNIAPDVQITAPTSTHLTGTVEIKGTVTDANPHHYWFVITNSRNIQVAGLNTVNETNLFTNKTLLNWDTSSLTEGQYTIKLEARDSANNKDSGSVHWLVVNVDRTKPTVDLQFNVGEKKFQAVFSENVNKDDAENPANYFLNNWPGAGGDGDLSGDADISYDSLTYTATVTFTNQDWYISPEQQWGVQNIHDLAGNILAVTPYTEYSTPMVAPETTISGIDTDWHSTDVTVELICTDIGGSGCSNTYYSLDGGKTYQEGNTVIVSTEGENKITYYSKDKAGNDETPHTSDSIKIDKTAPRTTLTDDLSGKYINQPILIKGVSTDTNGIDSVSIYYRLTGTTDWISLTNIDNTSNDSPYDFTYEWEPTSDGTYDIKVSATDIAGNIEQSAYIYALTYDSTAPSITVFNIVSNILNISANDLLSGTDKIEVKINDGAWTLYTTDINLNTILNNTPGTYTIYAKVTDKAGNITEGSTTYTIPERAVLGATTTTTKTTTKGITKTTSPISTTQTEEILETTSIIEEPSVLGERCENKKKVSGYVYIDKNKDKEMNENEEGIKDITLTIQYTDEEGNIKTEEEVNTDEKGYWETQLCSGKYNIVVKEETLPKNIEVAEVLSLTVPDNEEETIFDIQALDTRNFWQKYWYLIVGGLAIIAIGYISLKNRKKEEI